MPYFITKTGLDIFDLCRAYGLAALIDTASPEGFNPVINDAGSLYLVELSTQDISKHRLLNNDVWYQFFEDDPKDRIWNRLFLTAKQNWPNKVAQVKKILSEDIEKIVKDFQNPVNPPTISSSKGETLSGPLDPSAFKGLRGKTRGDYSEGQTRVDSHNWALACLGGAIAGRYIWSRASGGYFVIFPVPQKVELSNWREVNTWLKDKCRLNYIGIQNAAAHFAVIIAEKIREMVASRSQFTDRFSNLCFFSMAQSGQQFKPSAGGNLSLYPLMELAYSGSPSIAEVFKVWNSLFRKGCEQGFEDLGMAIVDFIMHPTLETYERHARIFLRYILRGKIKSINYYTEKNIREVINYAQ